MHDVVIVGGGHNGLVAAALLARAGRSVLVLERRRAVGGAAVSERVFSGVDARLSRFAYLVSLFPRALASSLGVRIELERRRVASCTPVGDRSLVIDGIDRAATAASLRELTGDPAAYDAWQAFSALCGHVAQRVFPTLTEPLRSREQMRVLVGHDEAWEALVERPLGEALEARFADDVVRGLVLTDALIGTFASAHDPRLRQNRCFLYHVIGNGTGDWDVPVGGMGAISDALAEAAQAAGATIRTDCEVVGIDADGRGAVVRDADGGSHDAGAVVANVAPPVLARLLGSPPPAPAAPGSQLKINMLLRRLPCLRDGSLRPATAFAGTFHVHESYSELEAAHAAAAAGRLPDPLPCELYCHTLADRTILGPKLADAGAQTLTLFALHTPARLFASDPGRVKAEATVAALAALDDVLAEPIRDLLWEAPDGTPCIEAHTPLDLEAELALPGGNIFHGELQWPWAQDGADVGRWGTETAIANVQLGGAGARRGGGVSGIAGHNAARALLGD